MNILEEIRKEIRKDKKINTKWFMHNTNWYIFSDSVLYTQDKTKSGPESVVEIVDQEEYDTILAAYKQKQ